MRLGAVDQDKMQEYRSWTFSLSTMFLECRFMHEMLQETQALWSVMYQTHKYYSDNTIYKQNMKTYIIKVSKPYSSRSHPCLYFSYCLCIISLASAADHMINKRIIAYFLYSMFTFIWQHAVQMLPSTQFSHGIGLLFTVVADCF